MPTPPRPAAASPQSCDADGASSAPVDTADLPEPWHRLRRQVCQWPLVGGALALGAIVGAPAHAADAAAAPASAPASGTAPAPPVRLALLMGNQNYPEPHDLPPVHKNVHDLAAALTRRGFDVTPVLDIDALGARQTLDAFARRVRAAPPDTVAFIYFVGHGLQLDAENLLVGAGVNPQARADVLARGSLVLARDVVREMPQRPAGLTVVVIDACRTSLRPTQSADDGLNQVEAPPGCLIVFSTGAGRPAIAPAVPTLSTFYTASLVKLLQNADDDVSFSDLFKLVKDDVQQTMGSHPVAAIRRATQVSFITENTRVAVAVAPRRAAAGSDAASFASAGEQDDYARLQQSLWPADIVRLADRFRQRFPASRVTAAVEVMRRGAAEAAGILGREDMRLSRRAFDAAAGTLTDAEGRDDLLKAARGDKDAAARIGRRFQTSAVSGPDVLRYENWMQFAAELGNGIASYELALHFRRLDQPEPAARWEARARELGYTPPPSLDNVR